MPPDGSRHSDLKQLYEQASDVRKPFERGWFLNLAAFEGNQWLYWAGSNLHQPDLDPWRVTFTDNRIISIVRKEIAKMTKSRPIWTCTPRTSQEQDVDASRVAERVMDHYWLDLRLARKLRTALRWSRICGAGFWKVYWDKETGDEVELLAGPDGQPLKNPGGGLMRADDPAVGQFMAALPPEAQAQVSSTKMAQGDARVEVKSPFQLAVDPLLDESVLEEAEFIIEDAVRSVAYMKDRYDVELEPDTDAVSGMAEARMPELRRGEFSGGTGKYRGVRVFELWAKPSSRYGQAGKRAVWTAKQVLLEEDNPYDVLPYAMFAGVPVSGRFWPTSVTEQARPLNVELNKSRSQVRENAARFGNPAMLQARHADVEYTGLPGETILFDATLAESVPAYLQPPEMPSYVMDESERIVEALRDVSSQHEVTQGTVPSGVTAASAINLLLEADDSIIGPDMADMEDALSQAGTMLLTHVANFVDDERTMRIAGEDDSWDIFAFRTEQLRDHTQIEVQSGSTLPRSKAAKQAAMHDLFSLVIQYGVPIRERDLRRFFKDYEVGGLEQLFAEISKDETQINREHRIMVETQEGIPTNSFDNHELHISGHEEFMKSGRFWHLPDQLKMIFEAHVLAHRTAFVKMMPQAGAGPAPAGMEAGPGAAGPPSEQPAAAGNGSVPGGSENATRSTP